MKPSVMFIVPYPLKRAPSQRFRVELYEGYLQEAGIDYVIEPFLDQSTYNIIYKKGSLLQKAAGITRSYIRRLKTVFRARKYNFVFIHREAAPIGPPVFEWILAVLFRKKLIYDFDDAIWIPNTSGANLIASGIKCFWKVKHIIRMSYRVAPGNAYLAAYARQYNPAVTLLPTCVDVVGKHNIVKDHNHTGKPVIGWTGSHSTLFYIQDILPVLQELQEIYDFRFMVIADKKPEITLRDWVFIPWNEKTEQEDLIKMDIGIMPLKPDAWSEGKCGFKLIQYLSCGIPAIADPVGVNKDIIEPGINGFLCNSPGSWKKQLSVLLEDPALRSRMGKAGREKIIREYSIQSQKEVFLGLFS